MGRRVQNPLIIRQEVSAGRAALARRHHVLIRAIRVHDENLIAIQLVASRLKNDSFPVRSPVRLSILAAESYLRNVAKMQRALARMRSDCLCEASRQNQAYAAKGSSRAHHRIVYWSG